MQTTKHDRNDWRAFAKAVNRSFETGEPVAAVQYTIRNRWADITALKRTIDADPTMTRDGNVVIGATLKASDDWEVRL